MHTSPRLLLLTLASFGVAISTSAGAAASAEVATVQPALSALVAPRAAELNEAGIQTIVARTGNQLFDIQVLTIYGPAYAAWPQGVTPTAFRIEIGPATALTVRAEGYSEANQGRYVAAFDAVLPRALRAAQQTRAHAQRPRS